MRQELGRLVEGRRERHMWLKGGILFVEEVPKSKAGKILRRVLKERAVRMRKAKL
jgi:acyl-coenzyme A synthetase/AMP-(fatty) acid ligase